MARTATGRIAGPDRPPVTPAELRPHPVGVDDHAEQRVDHRQPVGAGLHAGLRRRDDVGDVGGELGEDRDVARAAARGPARRPWPTASGSQAKTRPRLATLGQEMLTSTPTTASKASLAAQRRPRRRRTRRSCCRRSRPATRAPACLSQARSLSTNASMPGPCRPIELSIPAGVSAIRGVPRPDRGSAMTDLVTNAPSSRRRRTGQLPAVGGAAGGRHQRARQRSPPPSVARRCRPPSVATHLAGAPTASSGTRHDPVVEGVPADPVAAEDRALDAGPHHPGRARRCPSPA